MFTLFVKHKLQVFPKLHLFKIKNEMFILVYENLYYKEFLDLISKNLDKPLTKYPLTKSILYTISFLNLKIIFLSFIELKAFSNL